MLFVPEPVAIFDLYIALRHPGYISAFSSALNRFAITMKVASA
jgi:hypothetical protein